MKTRLLTAVAAFLLAALGFASAEIGWAKDWSSAVSAAKNANKLIMIDFYTDWCGWCKKLDSDTYTDASVVALSKNLVAVKLDAERAGAPLAKKYNVDGYPTILFVDAQGAVFGRIGGYLPPDQFRAEMAKSLETFRSFPSVSAALKANPKDGEANARMAKLLAARGDTPGAEKCLDAAEKSGYKGKFMAGAYNAVGDCYQNEEKFKQAIGYFKKADACSNNLDDKGYAQISIMYCLLGDSDIQGAKRQAKQIIATPNMPKQYVNMAKEVLNQIGG